VTRRTWADIWAARRLDPAHGSRLRQLMAADGLDTGFGDVEEAAWRAFVRRSAATAGIAPGASVFEVGCGAGAFLYELDAMGCAVGGVDASAALVGYARAALPRGRWSVGDAADLDVTEPWDYVGACGVFLYFPTLEYAGRVLARMVRKARRGVFLLDVPDLAKREATEAERRRRTGEQAYAARYDGLEHLYVAKDWFVRELAALGARDVRVEDQVIAGYGNAAGRYNVFASSSAHRA